MQKRLNAKKKSLMDGPDLELAVSGTLGSTEYNNHNTDQFGSNKTESGPNYVIDGPDSDEENDHSIGSKDWTHTFLSLTSF